MKIKVKAGLLVVLVLIALLPAASAQGEVVDHKVCGEISDNQPEDIKDTFYTDDVVHSWVELSEAKENATLKWVFRGPKDFNKTTTTSLQKDVNGYHSSINLWNYAAQDVVGNWTIECYLDGEKAFTDKFKAKPITGGLWITPGFTALSFLLAISATIIYLYVKK